MPALSSLAIGAVASKAGGALAGPIAGFIGSEMSKGDRAKAQEAANKAFQEIESIGAPPDVAREILVKHFKQVGIYTPKLETAIQQGVSEMSKVKEDSSLRDAQMTTLEQLKQQGRTGLTPVERAELNKIRRETDTSARGRQESILQNMQTRGMGGSGAELAAGLASSQNAAQNESEQADRQAAMAYQNALQAISSGGQLAGSIRGQDFNVNSAKASAADELNRFNVNQKSMVQQRNTDRENQAATSNLENEQNVSNMNTSTDNDELRRQRQAEMDLYNANVRRSQLRSNNYTGQSNMYNEMAKNTQQGAANIGAGIGGMFSEIGDGLTNAAKPPAAAAAKK